MKLADRYLVKIEEKHETEFKHGSLTLLKPSLSERIEGSDGKTCSYNPDQHLAKTGVIISLPHTLTKTNARMINVGHPQHSRYISSEMILAGGNDRNQYNPSTYTDKFATFQDIYKIEASVGDIVYYYHTAIDKSDPVMPDLYAINVSNVFAYQKGDQLFMCHGFALCEYIARNQKSESGLLLAGQSKYELNIGKVVNSAKDSELTPGETVYYKKNGDYPVVKDGKEYFVVREYDCYCACG